AAVTPRADLPVTGEAGANLLLEARLEAVAVDGRLEEELGAEEEPAAAGVGGVLMRGDDVCPPLEQKARDRGHDPGPVGAGDQQACGIALGAVRGGIIRLLASLPGSGHAGGSYLLV